MGPTGPEIKIDGAAFHRRVRKATPTERALYAHDLQAGLIGIGPFTGPQARFLAQCSFGYQNTVNKLAPHELERLRRGWVKLAELHNTMTDGDVLRLVKRIGADRVLRAIDMLTAPPQMIAAE
jgi:hypothetical protein